MRFIFFCKLLILVLLLTSCGINQPLTINDIAYNFFKSSGYTVYIQESLEYFPYLVITNDYNNNCLLLRENLLNEHKSYENELHYIPSYYENSKIDLFLNNEFLSSLSSTIQDKITDSTITITDEETIRYGGKVTKNIQRKVFLLSYTEVVGGKSSMNIDEGKYLKYFKHKHTRSATTSKGETSSWWLRTPDIAFYNVVYGVSPEGYIGYCSTTTDVQGNSPINGVRPAFCLPRNTILYKDMINGKKCYFIVIEIAFFLFLQTVLSYISTENFA